MQPIRTTDELAAACARLARHPFVTVDTEFLRETTYYPLLCVAQIASADEAVVIDALADGIDLDAVFELMANEKVLKVFHAARQDIEIVWHMAERIPHPIFDTQVAAMVLGYGDSHFLRPARAAHHRRQARQVEPLHRLVAPAAVRRPDSPMRCPTSRICATSIWRSPPTSTGAAAPTGSGDEMEVLTSPETYRAEPENAWRRLKTRVRKPKELAVLIEVAAWREREAQTRDVPRGRVLKDDALGDIAMQAPTTLERLGQHALAAEGIRAIALGRGHHRSGQARARARSEIPAAARTRSASAPTAAPPSNC